MEKRKKEEGKRPEVFLRSRHMTIKHLSHDHRTMQELLLTWGVLLPHVGEKVVDEFAHKMTRMVNSCY